MEHQPAIKSLGSAKNLTRLVDHEADALYDFCIVKWMRVFDSSLDVSLIHRRLAPSRRWYSFTNLIRMESRVSYDEKEGRANARISEVPQNEPGILRLEGIDLTSCANHETGLASSKPFKNSRQASPVGKVLDYRARGLGSIPDWTSCLCSNICKWLDFRVFSDKEVKL